MPSTHTAPGLRVCPGDWVSHPRWGDGLVVQVEGSGARTQVEVEFTHARVWLVLADAPLVKTTMPSRYPVRLGPGQHPDWCARGHGCNLGEHRAAPVTLAANRAGVVVLTRVLAADGRQHVEVRTRIVLAPGEREARGHLARILADLDAHLRRVIHRPT